MSNRQAPTMPDVHNGHIMVDGELVSAEITRVIRAMKDYCDEIDVQWIPPRARKKGDSAFAVIHNPPYQPPYVLFYVPKEEDFDDRQLARLIANDQRNGEKTWDEYTAWEEAQKLMGKQDYLDMLEEANDIAQHILKTKLNTYKVNDQLTIKDGIPFNANDLKD